MIAFRKLAPGRWANEDGVFQPIRGVWKPIGVPPSVVLLEGMERYLYDDANIKLVMLQPPREKMGWRLRHKVWDRHRIKKVIWPVEHGKHWILLVVHLDENNRRIIMNCSLGESEYPQ